MSQINLKEIVNHLDSYLLVKETPDYPQAMNGLQVEGREMVRRVAFAVDACLYTISKAVSFKADLLIVHHGLFWDFPAPIRGPMKERLKTLLDGNLSLYSVHLPLDKHPEVGNNVTLARAINFKVEGTFATFQGVEIGVIATGESLIDDLKTKLSKYLGGHPIRVLKFGANTVKRIGIVSGGGSQALNEAVELELDTFITGEAPHHSYFVAEEGGLNLILAGHYATEQVGLWSLMKYLKEKFGVETIFIEHPTGM